MKMNDLGSDFSKSYLIYIEECLGTFYSKHPSGPHLPLCMVVTRIEVTTNDTVMLEHRCFFHLAEWV